MLVQEGVKFSAAGDIGVGNIKLAQTANVDKVKIQLGSIQLWLQRGLGHFVIKFLDCYVIKS